MKLLFFGSGAFGLPTVQHLHASERHDLVAVVSQPDKPAGRKRELTATPVAAWAAEHDVPVYKSDDVNADDMVRLVRGFGVEASVVIAFGQKLSPELIDAMGRLAINVHSSLLPKYRGAAPINWAMIEDEKATGVSVIGLAQTMDAGEVYATASTDIDPRETAGELHDRLAELGPGVVDKVLADLEADALAPVEQGHDAATRAPKFTKADGSVDLSMPAAKVRARVHGLTPWPGCRVTWRSARKGEAQTLFLRRVADGDCEPHTQPPGTVQQDLRVACGEGSIELLEVQLPGGKLLDFDDFVRGHGFAPGDTLSTVSRP
ncbi:MAG: methionyl-tRNA formyltransferase [Planctomycetota bacterium]